MKRIRINTTYLLMGIVALLLAMPTSGVAGLGDGLSNVTEEAESLADADAYLDKLALGDIVKVEGDEVTIRLTPGQYRSSKATSRIKRRGRVRIVLRPRQVLALQDALGENISLAEGVIHIDPVELRRSRLPKERVESHFVVKPVSDFL